MILQSQYMLGWHTGCISTVARYPQSAPNNKWLIFGTTPESELTAITQLPLKVVVISIVSSSISKMATAVKGHHQDTNYDYSGKANRRDLVRNHVVGKNWGMQLTTLALNDLNRFNNFD